MSAAFVVGYTGETGKELVKELISCKRFDRLVLIGRKQAEPNLPGGVEVKGINFDKLDEHKSDFAGYDQGFCCLGSTRGKNGLEAFLKVDRDYIIKVAELAKEGGCKHYHLVSSAGAAPSYWSTYFNTKFLAEEATITAGFDRVSIYRPGMILCDREESRPMEHIGRILMTPIAWALPTWFTTPVNIIAKAMVSRSLVDDEPEPAKDVTRLNIADLFKWAEKLPAAEPNN